ncbi:hypothetical protein CBM2598_U10126 [Cupriavidus taiwanensis]|nr:hypothetical protein CBM2598_U10126 [Cupriavidus taiwanensis]
MARRWNCTADRLIPDFQSGNSARSPANSGFLQPRTYLCAAFSFRLRLTWCTSTHKNDGLIGLLARANDYVVATLTTGVECSVPALLLSRMLGSPWQARALPVSRGASAGPAQITVHLAVRLRRAARSAMRKYDSKTSARQRHD